MIKFLKLLFKAFKPKSILTIIIYISITIFGLTIWRVTTTNLHHQRYVEIKDSLLKEMDEKTLESVNSQVVSINEEERMKLNIINTANSPVIIPKTYLPPPFKNEEIIICRTYNGLDCLPNRPNGKSIGYRQYVEKLGYKYINNRTILVDPQPNMVTVTYLVLYVSKEEVSDTHDERKKSIEKINLHEKDKNRHVSPFIKQNDIKE